MIDFNKIIGATEEDALKEAKLWLFEENIRLENEKKSIKESREKLCQDQVCFRQEVDTVKRQIKLERKRLKEESLFFDKKMMILRAGFAQLEADRKSFEKEKCRYEQLKSRTESKEPSISSSDNVAARLFENVNDPLALRKRYRDLVKIYHPDNMNGDSELITMINKEFFRRKREE